MDLERERRLPFRPLLSPQAMAQQAFDDALEAFDGPREAFEAIAGYIKRMREGKRAMAYDSRWGVARDTWARDQGPEEYSDEELLGLIREAIGEEGPLGDALRARASDRRQATDQPPSFQAKPLAGGGQIPTTGNLEVDPAGSRSANSITQDYLPPSLRKQHEDMRTLTDPVGLRANAQRFPQARRLGRVG
jgi:hypothetical protein